MLEPNFYVSLARIHRVIDFKSKVLNSKRFRIKTIRDKNFSDENRICSYYTLFK